MEKKLHVKTGDMVIVVSGDDKGKTGKVVEVSPKEGKVIVRFSCTAKSARRLPVPLTRSTATRKPASALSAALSCNSEVYDGCKNERIIHF